VQSLKTIASLLICIPMTATAQAAIPTSTYKSESSSAARHVSEDEREIRQVLADWLAALQRGDLVALERIIAEDYIITVGGRQLGREEDLEPIRAGTLHFASATTDSVRVRVFGIAAVVTGIGAYRITMGEKSADVRERFTDVYVKRGGRWQPVASHSTPLPR
jgi:uncharacterized protein (TIGR02246 family)